MATDEEGEKPKQVEQEGDHRIEPGFSPDRGYEIDHLTRSRSFEASVEAAAALV